MRILVTGGAGYIGSHTTLRLLEVGHEVSVFDNLSNASSESIRRVSELADRPVQLFTDDLLNMDRLRSAMETARPEAVIHFAGLKAVGESGEDPIRYYKNNVQGSLNLISVMNEYKVKKLVFSSSATVYKPSGSLPFSENSPLGPTNPYGRTKLQIEEVLNDVASSDAQWSIARLRYFNPVGAHSSGLIGEDPLGTPNNLVPFISQVAVGLRPKLKIFGNDYPTPDGTGVRDYIHVMDLAEGHLAALDFIIATKGSHVWNLGTGSGHSVLEVLDTFSTVLGFEVPYEVAGRRKGDVSTSYADTSAAREQLSWKATHGLIDMVKDSWQWQRCNPQGYRTTSGQ